MSKKKRFNVIYNNDETIGYGKGYYVIYENHDGEPTYDSFYRIWTLSSDYEAINTNILGRIKYTIDIGYVFDPHYTCDLKELF